MNYKSYKKYSLIFYGLSLITPIFFKSGYLGIFGLIFGWIALFEAHWVIGIPWLANLIYFINLLIFKAKIKLRIGLSIITLLCGLLTVRIKEVPVHTGGLHEDVVVGIGFGVWMLSFLLLLIGQVNQLNKKTVGKI